MGKAKYVVFLQNGRVQRAPSGTPVLLTEAEVKQRIDSGIWERDTTRPAIRPVRIEGLRGLSASPGPHLIERYAEHQGRSDDSLAGDPLAVAAVEGWA